MSSILQQIQAECANSLAADPYFANVPVLTQFLQDLGSRVDQALASLGVCVTVLVPVASVGSPNQPGPYFERIRIIARITENVVVNQNPAAGGTGKGALEVCEYVCAVLHHFRPQNLSETVVCDSPTITLTGEKERLVYEVAFTTQGGLAYALPSLDAPIFSQSGETLILASPTSAGVFVPGAAIFYTVDGTFPSPRNGALYTAPFSVGPGLTAQATAWLAGYLSSPTAKHLCT